MEAPQLDEMITRGEIGAKLPLNNFISRLDDARIHSERTDTLKFILNRKQNELVKEISAILIQKRWRGVRGRIKAVLCRLENSIKESLAQKMQEALLQEFLLVQMLEVGDEVVDRRNHRLDMQTKLGRELDIIADELMGDVCSSECASVVQMAIRVATEEYMAARPSKRSASSNPFVAIIVSLLDTVVTLEVPGIVNEAVDEETLEYLLDRRAERAFEALVIEPIQDICLEDGGPIEVAIEEMDEELAVEGILHAAADELAEEVGQKAVSNYAAEIHQAMEAEDMQAISDTLAKSLAVRSAATYLNFLHKDGFDNVLREHWVRAITRRVAAQRLLQYSERAQRQISTLVENEMSRKIFQAVTMPQLQQKLLQAMLTAARQYESHALAFEAEVKSHLAQDD